MKYVAPCTELTSLPLWFCAVMQIVIDVNEESNE